MSQIETLGILDEIEALVSDKLQVVSYKWLSRNFLVTSNAAKRLLQEFVEKQGTKLEVEVVYTVSGWLNHDPPVYHIRLVSASKLSESRQEFNGNCSVQVYSVQPSIPKDPAALWNAEFVQAEELFKQPPAVDNCLRDNRFCGISSSFVKRNADGKSTTIAASVPKVDGLPVPSKSTSADETTKIAQPNQRKPQKSSPEGCRTSSGLRAEIKLESDGIGVHCQTGKPSADKEKAPPLPANKKDPNDNSSSRTGSSLANLWGRASAKSKSTCAAAEPNESVQNPSVSAEAQICVREAVIDGSSDDEGQIFNFQRVSNVEGGRKRRVVLDLSDEEDFYEDAVNLASPDMPNGKSCVKLNSDTKSLTPEKSNSDFDKKIEGNLEVKEERETDKKVDQLSREDSSLVAKGKGIKLSSPEKSQGDIAANNLPKRRKVLKTRIDERGREVTEVVWEDEETKAKAAKQDNSDTTKKTDKNTVTGNINRPPLAKKSPAIGSTAPHPVGKAGNKKAGNWKDPKQGNILSFFKKA